MKLFYSQRVSHQMTPADIWRTAKSPDGLGSRRPAAQTLPRAQPAPKAASQQWEDLNSGISPLTKGLKCRTHLDLSS